MYKEGEKLLLPYPQAGRVREQGHVLFQRLLRALACYHQALSPTANPKAEALLFVSMTPSSITLLLSSCLVQGRTSGDTEMTAAWKQCLIFDLVHSNSLVCGLSCPWDAWHGTTGGEKAFAKGLGSKTPVLVVA